MARRHRARRHAVLGHRLRRADARLRVPVAVAADARDRRDRRHRARPHRHGAQPRPLRPVGLGPRARPHLLVAVDVRHSRPAAARQAAQLRRGQRAGASRRRAALRARRRRSPTRAPPRSTAPSACATRAATGCGCARAASWCARPASRIRTSSASRSTSPSRSASPSANATADMRLRDAIEAISEAFVVWDADNRLVLCNSKFQKLHGLPDEAAVRRHALRGHRGCRQHADRAHAVRATAARARRAHLRGAARRRPLAADQRAAHQGRRLRLGRHRHHRAEAPRGEADRERDAAEGDGRRPAHLAAGAGAADRSSSPIWPSNTPSRRTAPRKPTRRSPSSSPT